MNYKLLIGLIVLPVLISPPANASTVESVLTKAKACKNLSDKALKRTACYERLIDDATDRTWYTVRNNEKQDCSLLSDILERGQCLMSQTPPELDYQYFETAVRLSAMQPNIEKSAGKWKITKTINPVDDTKSVVVSLNANSGQNHSGDKVRLVLRCMQNHTDVIINWGEFLESSAAVLTRLGKNKAKTNKWSLSSNREASFYPGSSIGFISKLMGVDGFVAQITPYNENTITAVFDTDGLSKAIKPLRSACEW